MNLSGIRGLVLSCFGATLLFAGCEKPNTAPVAEFSFSPTSGAMDTIFTFDASGSSDVQDNIGSLEVRWDWDADGTWDTGYTLEKIASHRFDHRTLTKQCVHGNVWEWCADRQGERNFTIGFRLVS